MLPRRLLLPLQQTLLDDYDDRTEPMRSAAAAQSGRGFRVEEACGSSSRVIKRLLDYA